jgi:hypothetical protein
MQDDWCDPHSGFLAVIEPDAPSGQSVVVALIEVTSVGNLLRRYPNAVFKPITKAEFQDGRRSVPFGNLFANRNSVSFSLRPRANHAVAIWDLEAQCMSGYSTIAALLTDSAHQSARYLFYPISEVEAETAHRIIGGYDNHQDAAAASEAESRLAERIRRHSPLKMEISFVAA